MNIKLDRLSRRVAQAFTRADLVMTLTGVAILVAVVAPVLAGNKSSSDRAVCANNLHAVGNAMNQWVADAADHETPWWSWTAAGGSSYNPRVGVTYLEFYTFANQLRYPAMLTCPADVGVIKATNWYDYRWVLQNRAVSYGINLEGAGFFGRQWALADQNMNFDESLTLCSVGMNNTSSIRRTNGTRLSWEGAVHGQQGNVLFWDTSVEFTSTARLRAIATDEVNDDSGVSHVLKAR